MNCKDVQVSLSSFQDRELDGNTNALIRKHLGSCRDCRHEFQRLKNLEKRLKDLREHDPGRNFSEQVMARIVQKRERRRVLLPSFAYSLVFLLVFILGLLLNSGWQEQQQKQNPMVLTKLLLESQTLNLVAVQDDTLDLLAMAGSHEQ